MSFLCPEATFKAPRTRQLVGCGLNPRLQIRFKYCGRRPMNLNNIIRRGSRILLWHTRDVLFTKSGRHVTYAQPNNIMGQIGSRRQSSVKQKGQTNNPSSSLSVLEIESASINSFLRSLHVVLHCTGDISPEYVNSSPMLLQSTNKVVEIFSSSHCQVLSILSTA